MIAEDMARLHAVAMPDARPWHASEFQALLTARGAVVAANDHCFAIGRVTLDEAELILIATHPDARQQGHASRVLDRFFQNARAQGAKSVFLEVASSNHAARTLYARSGWHETGQRKGYYSRADGSKEDAILMAKPL